LEQVARFWNCHFNAMGGRHRLLERELLENDVRRVRCGDMFGAPTGEPVGLDHEQVDLGDEPGIWCRQDGVAGLAGWSMVAAEEDGVEREDPFLADLGGAYRRDNWPKRPAR
jgi:hypothetical protein